MTTLLPLVVSPPLVVSGNLMLVVPWVAPALLFAAPGEGIKAIVGLEEDISLIGRDAENDGLTLALVLKVLVGGELVKL